jgi:hypothetical protein
MGASASNRALLAGGSRESDMAVFSTVSDRTRWLLLRRDCGLLPSCLLRAVFDMSWRCAGVSILMRVHPFLAWLGGHFEFSPSALWAVTACGIGSAELAVRGAGAQERGFDSACCGRHAPSALPRPHVCSAAPRRRAPAHWGPHDTPGLIPLQTNRRRHACASKASPAASGPGSEIAR